MAAILEVKDLHCSYGPIHALRGISFHVDEGEVVTLVGSNGAGKTTTLRSLSGLLDNAHVTGEVLFMGQPIHKMKASKVASLGLCQCLEGRHIFPQLTVEENLMIGAFQRNDTAGIQEDLQKMFKRFPRLEERRKQAGGTLSGGEQQMLAIARALMSKPKMLMMDEPSLGLAPIIVAEIFEIVKDINRDGIPVLLVEQNCNMALKVSHRGYVLETGEVTLEGTSEFLANNEEVRKSYLGG